MHDTQFHTMQAATNFPSRNELRMKVDPLRFDI